MSRRTSRSRVLWAILLVSCQANYPEGNVACVSAAECPAHWFCVKAETAVRGQCYSSQPLGQEVGRDAGSAKAPPDAAQPSEETAKSRQQPDSAVAPDAATEEAGGFAIVARSPDQDEVLEDLRSPVTVTFSAPVDPNAQLTEKLPITRNGEAVSGNYSVQGARVIFTPEHQWSLNARYEVRALPSLEGREHWLVDEAHWSFSARAGRWGYEQMSQQGAAAHRAPRLAVSSRGNVALAWLTHEGANKIVQLRRRLDDGWQELPTAVEFPYDVAINNQGRLAISTQDLVRVYDAKNQELYDHPLVDARFIHLRLTETGETNMLFERDGNLIHASYPDVLDQTVETLLARPPIESSYAADFAQLDRAWYVAYSTSYYRADDDAGTAEQSAVVLTDAPACGPDCLNAKSQPGHFATQVRLGSARNADSLIAVWSEQSQSWMTIRATRRTTTTSWSKPVTLSVETGDATEPRIALDASGNAVALWLQVAGESTHAMVASYDARSDRWSTPFNLSRDAEHIASDPALTMNAAGDAIAAWDEKPTAPEPEVYSGVARCSIFTQGVGWSKSPMTLSRKDRATSFPVVGITDDGRAYASWEDAAEIWFGRYE
jgi:hypothetical protein